MASDLTIGPAPHALHQRNEPGAGKLAAVTRKPVHAKNTKARHAEKDRQHQHRIVTYNLFHDPILKLGGAITDKRHHVAHDMRSLVSDGSSGTVATGPGLLSTRVPSAAVLPLKLAEPENEGFALDCQEKPFTAVPVRRRFTACFKQKLDNAWKTQTYVSGARADGTMNWGGGLALGYDY